MRKHSPAEETGRVIALAAGLLAVAIASVPAWAAIPLAVFASLYAPLVYLLDPQVRGFVRALGSRIARRFRSTRAKSPGARPAAT